MLPFYGNYPKGLHRIEFRTGDYNICSFFGYAGFHKDNGIGLEKLVLLNNIPSKYVTILRVTSDGVAIFRHFTKPYKLSGHKNSTALCRKIFGF
jgi:hypothetical protein